nr:MAG TPA: hypothetical protein [Caudoviricetes sp.]
MLADIIILYHSMQKVKQKLNSRRYKEQKND